MPSHLWFGHRWLPRPAWWSATAPSNRCRPSGPARRRAMDDGLRRPYCGGRRRSLDTTPCWRDAGLSCRVEHHMAGMEVKNFASPDETRPFTGKGKAEIVSMGGTAVGRGTFEPGWKWSENVKPL